MAGLAERAADTVLTLPAEPPASPAATPIWYASRVARARGQERGSGRRAAAWGARARAFLLRAPRAPPPAPAASLVGRVVVLAACRGG
jgi:hypothetical protein